MPLFEYCHPSKRLWGSVELEVSESDTLTDSDLEELGRELAMQIAATKPIGLDRQSKNIGVLSKSAIKDVESRRRDLSHPESYLLSQKHIKNPELTVRELITMFEGIFGATVSVIGFSHGDDNRGDISVSWNA